MESVKRETKKQCKPKKGKKGEKISNKYRFKIIIKCKNNSEFRALLSKILCEFGKNKEFSGVTAYADMNALVC